MTKLKLNIITLIIIILTASTAWSQLALRGRLNVASVNTSEESVEVSTFLTCMRNSKIYITKQK